MSKISEELRKEHLEVKGKIKCLEKNREIAQKAVIKFLKEFDDVKQRGDALAGEFLICGDNRMKRYICLNITFFLLWF